MYNATQLSNLSNWQSLGVSCLYWWTTNQTHLLAECLLAVCNHICLVFFMIITGMNRKEVKLGQVIIGTGSFPKLWDMTEPKLKFCWCEAMNVCTLKKMELLQVNTASPSMDFREVLVVHQCIVRLTLRFQATYIYWFVFLFFKITYCCTRNSSNRVTGLFKREPWLFQWGQFSHLYVCVFINTKVVAQ